jgi:chemotaxis protein CheZ
MEKRPELAVVQGNGLMNGPQIKADNPEAVTDQAQVDDLLESLGF